MAFHQMGASPYHTQILADMIGYPWKQLHYCFCKTEDILRKFKANMTGASVSAAQAAECEATMKEKGSDVKLMQRIDLTLLPHITHIDKHMAVGGVITPVLVLAT
eukprot:4847331-Ditylum_brightwellii.AAC.1